MGFRFWKNAIRDLSLGCMALAIFSCCHVRAQTLSAQSIASEPSGSSHADRQTVRPVFVGLGPSSFSSNSQIPVPEAGGIQSGVYSNSYFELSYPVPREWVETFKGPPPSATGYYVLAQLKAAATSNARGTISISASDMFFLLQPAANVMDVLKNMKLSLPDVMTVERPLSEMTLAKHPFARLDYNGAGIHWVVLSTELRCHAVQFVFVSRDPELIEKLVSGFDSMRLPAEADLSEESFPVCLKDYANEEHVLHKVEPSMAGPRFTSVPVRIIVDREGRVKHIHVINGFPEQAKSISEALSQWTFKPYVKNGKALEVETGLLFDFKPDGVKTRTDIASAKSVSEAR